MSDESNALIALKNAWNGAIAASEEVAKAGPAVEALQETTPMADLDLERYHRLALAQSNAVMALRGLLEELKRRFTAPPAA